MESFIKAEINEFTLLAEGAFHIGTNPTVPLFHITYIANIINHDGLLSLASSSKCHRCNEEQIEC